MDNNKKEKRKKRPKTKKEREKKLIDSWMNLSDNYILQHRIGRPKKGGKNG
jgi:hypothetical protein